MPTLLFYALRCSLLIFFGLLLLCPSLSYADVNSTENHSSKQPPRFVGELWTGSIYTSTFQAGACFAPDGRIRGVLLLKLSNGQVDTYHFHGTISDEGIINTFHKSGHNFVGKFIDEQNISGKATLSNGFSTTLAGKRLKNVQLNERCGPIEE